MTCYYNISETAQGVFGGIALLLMAGTLWLLIWAATMHLHWQTVVLAAGLSLAAIAVLQGVGDVSYIVLNGYKPVRLSKVMGELPWGVVALLLGLLAGAEAVFWGYLRHRQNNMLTSMAVKESVDALPDGICFFCDDGQPLLVNTRMNQISWEIFGSELLNAAVFWQKLRNAEGCARFLNTRPTVQLQTKDGRVWDFRCTRRKVGRKEVQELVAYDVTTLSQLHQELDARNRSLSAANGRLRRYSREVERITGENEILNAKIQVHNDVGRCLLMFRTYLAQPASERNREELLLLWQRTVAVLKQETVQESRQDDWELLCQAARSMDVKIVCDGTLPEEETARSVIIMALHECLTNTVKHANGDRLYLTLSHSDTALTAQLTNNGSPPAAAIRETGGLRNLRHAVERAGGMMTIESAPRFFLRVVLPRGNMNYGKDESDDCGRSECVTATV